MRSLISLSSSPARWAAGATANGDSRRALKSFVGGVQHGSMASGIEEDLMDRLFVDTWDGSFRQDKKAELGQRLLISR